MNPLFGYTDYYNQAAQQNGLQAYPNQMRGNPLMGNTDYRNTAPGVAQTSQLPQDSALFSIPPEVWLQGVQEMWPDSVFTRFEPATIENTDAPQMIRDAYNQLMGFDTQ